MSARSRERYVTLRKRTRVSEEAASTVHVENAMGGSDLSTGLIEHPEMWAKRIWQQRPIVVKY